MLLKTGGLSFDTALGAWLLGMDAPLMWGGLAALLNFIPYIGPLAMMGLLALFGLGTAETVFLGVLPAIAPSGHGLKRSDAASIEIRQQLGNAHRSKSRPNRKRGNLK